MDSTTTTSGLQAGLFNGITSTDLGYVNVGVTANIADAVVKDKLPYYYRLCKKNSGVLVLQGGFKHSKGWDNSWIEWEDLETVNE